MRIAIMQPYFMPYIGYFQLIDSVDEFIVYDKVNFIKKGYVDRNSILINKAPYFIKVPLCAKSSYKKICDISIKEDNMWRKKMLLDIYMSYKKAKCFDEVFPILSSIINTPVDKISQLNFEGIKTVCDYLGLTTKLTISNNDYNGLENDLESKCFLDKNSSNLKFNDLEQKSVRIIEICKLNKANIYINPIGGLNLYSKEDFLLNEIGLKFIKMGKICYNQFDNQFFSNLSIIDVLMHNDKEDIIKFIKNYELV